MQWKWGLGDMGAWYTFLGDSITAGASATAAWLAYPHRTVCLLQTRPEPLEVEVLAGSGWTTGALLSAVYENSSVYLTGARGVTVWIGGDNMAEAGMAIAQGAPTRVIQQTLAVYARDLALLLGSIRRLRRLPVIVCTQYNPFPNTPMAAEAVSALNATTAQVATRLGALVAPVHDWFVGREPVLISGFRTGRIEDVLVSSSPPIHPNNAGHQVISERLAPLLRYTAR